MKKIFFLTIAMIAILSLVCFAAFAEDISSIAANSNSATAVITASISEDSDKPVYCVTVDFDSMAFSYCKTWNPNANGGPAYSATWNSDSNKIIVTNKSNVAVNISFAYELEDDFLEDIETNFAKGSFSNNIWTETSMSYTIGVPTKLLKYNSTAGDWKLCAFLKLDGETTKLSSTATTIGTVTVTASAATN